MKKKSKEWEKKWKKCREGINMKQILMHHHLLSGNKMTSIRTIPTIIGALISHSKIRDITMSRWMVVIDSLITMMITTVEIKTKTSILTKIKVWMVISEEDSNNSRIKIIVTSRTTTIATNNRDLTNNRAGKSMYTILKSIGMKIQMWGLTQLHRPLNQNSLSQKRKRISRKPKTLKTIITFPKITITTINSATGLILLITKVDPNNSNKDLIHQNSIDNNISNKLTILVLLLFKMNFNRISFNNSPIISTIIPTMSLTSRHLSLVVHSWMYLNLHLLLISWLTLILSSKNYNSSFQPFKKTFSGCNINKSLWWRTIIRKLKCFRSRSSRLSMTWRVIKTYKWKCRFNNYQQQLLN